MRLAAAAAQELAWARRGLLHRGGSSAAAVLVIALGTGLAITMASIAYGLFVRDLGAPAAHELRVVEYRDPLRAGDATPADILEAWQASAGPFTRMAGFAIRPVNLAAEGEAAEVRSAGFVTVDAFDVLGMAPAEGRGFTPEDAVSGRGNVVLLSDDLWRSRFGAGDVVGTDVRLDGAPARIVGIMPPGFAFPMRQELWIPTLPSSGADLRHREPPALVAFGRLRPGAEKAEAATALERVVRELRPEQSAEVGRSIGVRVVRFNEFRGGSVLRPLLGSMMAAALLVLLVASANVAGLLLARTTTQRREVGVRVALGGAGARIVLPFLAQGVLLAGAGILLGLGLASRAVQLFETMTSAAGKPYWMVVRLDLPILLFAGGVTLLVALVAASGPVLLALRNDSATLLRSGGRSVAASVAARPVRVLVILQIALSCGLLIGSGLVIRSLLSLTALDFPFAREEVLTALVRPPAIEYPDDASRARLHDELLSRVEAISGVERAALAYGLPSLAFDQFALQAENDQPLPASGAIRAWRGAGSAAILDLLAIPPVRGRSFRDADTSDSEAVAVVEEDLALALFGDVDPVGLRFREVSEDGPGRWRSVVGVTGDLRLEGITDLDRGMGYYVPLTQLPAARVPQLTVLAEGSRSSIELEGELRDVIAALDPDLSVADVRSLRALVGETSFFYEIFGGLFASFGIAGLFMACVGLYGLLSWSVARRVPELGMRMALGASGRSMVHLVMTDAAKQAAIGLVGGISIAAMAGDALSVLLFQVDPYDPLVYAAVMLLVACVSMAAAAAPAMRAARLDPMQAMRVD
jgi:putative ABC transport system permease protein